MLRYKIALKNVPFDSDYKNAIRFNSRTEQEAYFDVANIFANAPEINFDGGTLLNTSIYFVMPDNANMAELLGANYAIIQDTDENANPKYLYYFVTHSDFNAAKQVRLNLILDVIQTFYIDLTFSDCFIENAHISRFDQALHFDFTPESNLYTREEIRNTPKRLISRTKLPLKLGFGTGSRGKWFENYVEAWLYVYLKTSSLSGLQQLNTDEEVTLENIQMTYQLNESITNFSNHYKSPYICLAFPLFKNTAAKTSASLKISNYNWSVDQLYTLLAANEGGANVYGMKISHRPPFPSYNGLSGEIYSIGDVKENDSLDTANGVIWGNNVLTSDIPVGTALVLGTAIDFIICRINGTSSAVGIVLTDNLTPVKLYDTANDTIGGPYLIEAETGFSFSATEEEIKSDTAGNLNPKIYSPDLTEVSISINGQATTYDLMKIGNADFELLYNEVLSPDISRIYVRLNPASGDYGLYIQDTINDLTGLVAEIDMSVPYSENQLDTYLANNKNFFIQREMGYDYRRKGIDLQEKFGYVKQAGNLLSSAGKSVSGGAGTGGAAGAVGAGLSVLGSVINFAGGVIENATMADYSREGIEVERTLSDLTLDNMDAAPENIYNVNGNAFFTYSINKIGVYMEIRQALPRDLKSALDIMKRFGFGYNRLDNIKNVDNIRKYYNFVRADVETLSCPYGISDEIKRLIIGIFRAGIRFWNDTDKIFDYNVANYENWLDEGTNE